MRRPGCLLCCAFAAVVLWPRAAGAQDAQGKTFNLELFRPAVDSKGYFTVNASQPLGHLDVSVGLVGSYARDVLVLRGNGALFRASDLITAQVQGALGLFNWGELAVSLPVHMLFGGRGPSYVSQANSNLDSDLTFGAQMIGDLGVHAKARILDKSKYPLGLAVLASVYAPTGPSENFLGEGSVSLRPEVILDSEFGYARRFRMALNVGALVRPSKNTFTDRGTTLNVPGSNLDRAVNGGNPFCFPAPMLTMAPMTCGTGQSRSLGTQVTYALGVSGAVVPQKLELLAELSGYADVTGSGHAFPLEWRAGAKVYLASKSYFELGVGTGIVPDQTGSPAVRGFIGFIFEPTIAEHYSGAAKDEPDDHREPPDEPEPEAEARPPGEEVGPVRGPVRVRGHAIEIGKVYFETGKATIKPISYPILDALVSALEDYRQIELVEVQGHADERGDDDYNMRLTEDRSQAVKQYLIDHGVEPDRLQAHGYGETQPVCWEHAKKCWSKNRRVEFIILKQEGEIAGQNQ
jgi:outer membrane protein OmpA-like peptidoglycan-associated protein